MLLELVVERASAYLEEDPLALFRVVAHNPRVLGRMRRGGLLDPGSITIRQRELVILRTTARCRSEYEWGVHVAFFGPAAGLTNAETVATVVGSPSDPAWSWSSEAALLIALADALHDSASIAVSFVTNATRLAPEPGAPRFPGELVGT